uniref:Uncharacterized protein n=1 Tax=Molossus molossus TaxID=27622 RepID=A0A7J8ES08_MOLMO|nr:hypothetical protein HJG59_008772 [Molossus molossus]
MEICFYYFGIKNDVAINAMLWPLQTHSSVHQDKFLEWHCWVTGGCVCPCDSYHQIGLPGQRPLGWVRSTFLSHSMGEWKSWGQPSYSGSWPIHQSSESQEERQQPERVAMFTVARPAPGHCLVHSKTSTCFPREGMSVMW